MKIKKSKIVCFIFSIYFCMMGDLLAASLAGVTFPDQIKIENQELVLNGLGLRTATIFSFKVYVGALYLKKKNTRPEEFLNNEEIKYLEMRFVRDVAAHKIRDGWVTGFNNAVKNVAPIQKEIDEFNALMADMKEGDKMTMIFKKDEVIFTDKTGKKSTIKGKDFSQGLLSIWFINPSDKGLSKGLLGISD